MSIFVLWSAMVSAESCMKEWEISNASLWPQYYKPCCSWLFPFNRKPGMAWWGAICYSNIKWIPECKKVWTVKWRYYSDWKLLKKDESCKIKTVSNNCLKEWWIVNQNSYDANWTISKDCCAGLSYFEYRAPSASSSPMCYIGSKWTPQCKKVWTSNEWRYYPDWTLLKKDNECAKWTLWSSTSSSKWTWYIEWSLSYPSSWIPTNMEVCAEDVSTKKTICTNKQIKNSKYTYGVWYSLKVPVWNYNVFARIIWKNTKAYYTTFVTCWLDASCKSHSNITVVVAKDKTITNINPWDRYK